MGALAVIQEVACKNLWHGWHGDYLVGHLQQLWFSSTNDCAKSFCGRSQSCWTRCSCKQRWNLNQEFEYLPRLQGVTFCTLVMLPRSAFFSRNFFCIMLCNAANWEWMRYWRCRALQDVAIAYGYNNITRTLPQSHTQGKQQPLNHFTDLIRAEVWVFSRVGFRISWGPLALLVVLKFMVVYEDKSFFEFDKICGWDICTHLKMLWMGLRFQVAMAGFTEIVTWILCSHEENFNMVNRKDDENTAVIIGNPRSADFEVTSVALIYVWSCWLPNVYHGCSRHGIIVEVLSTVDT